mmetsp:Transcript_21095/g.47585  ORF Transcript_21095/g.47585 Transcript_21095/m.47585 type:complete len:239 (+) Transcript_21095:1054-1770(+)
MAAEASRVVNLEQETLRTFAAKQARVSSERARVAREKSLREKVAATRMFKQAWPGMVEDASQELEALSGAWCPPTVRQIRGDFLPWVYAAISRELDARDLAGQLLDSVLLGSSARHVELSAKGVKAQAEARARALKAKEKPTMLRVFLEAASLGLEEDTVVGPVEVFQEDTIKDVEQKITKWLFSQGISLKLPEEGILHLAMGGTPLDPSHKLLEAKVKDQDKLEVVLPPLNEDANEE